MACTQQRPQKDQHQRRQQQVPFRLASLPKVQKTQHSRGNQCTQSDDEPRLRRCAENRWIKPQPKPALRAPDRFAQAPKGIPTNWAGSHFHGITGLSSIMSGKPHGQVPLSTCALARGVTSFLCTSCCVRQCFPLMLFTPIVLLTKRGIPSAYPAPPPGGFGVVFGEFVGTTIGSSRI